jgi:hypothetical protein
MNYILIRLLILTLKNNVTKETVTLLISIFKRCLELKYS